MSAAIWRATESTDSYFILWWIFGLMASWLLAKEPGYYASKLHALVNDRIFLQGIRHKGHESSLVSRGWTLMAYAMVGLILAGSTHFEVSWIPVIPEGPWTALLRVVVWTLLLGMVLGIWVGLLRLGAWIAEFEEGFLWLKAGFTLVLHICIPVMLVIALVTRFGNETWVQMAYASTLGLLPITMGFRWVRLLMLAKELSMNRLFLMIFYICTFELIPSLVIALNQTHG